MGNRGAGIHAAIYFIRNRAVSRHMLFSEFEALLDGLGALPDYEDEEAKAVYTLIDKTGKIRAAVFFLLYFDEDGRADSGWNVPVERLAEISGSGPDLGGGPIRLACKSQCSINWHRDDLWDPDMTPGSNDFLLVKKAVEENRLRFKFEAPEEDVPTLAASGGNDDSIDEDLALASDNDKRIKLARLLKEQRLRIRTLEAYREKADDNSDREQRILIHAYKNEIQELRQQIEHLKLNNEKLQEKLSARNEQYISLQDKVSGQSQLVEDLERKLKNASAGEKEKLEKQKLEAELVLLREQLDRRDIDLAYRDEREEQLRAELEELKENPAIAGSDDAIIEKLKELEVVYTAYHPGAGHITMSSNEIREYVENPIAFVASKCFVTEEHYRAWLEHYEHPVCKQRLSDGTSCHHAVEKISSPSEFEPGIDDRCAEHQPEDLE